MDLDGKVAIVTGGGRGIGRATARKLAASGVRVIVASRTVAELKETEDELRDLGHECLAVQTDVTAKAEVDRMEGEATSAFGRVDVLVNNAGVAIHNPIQDIRI